jgi:beta-glucanase (GH16 family)
VVNNGLSLLTSGPKGSVYDSGGIGSAIAQTYGKYEVCCQMPQVNGISFIALLWPDEGTWPIDGEIDFLESGSGPFNATLHYGSNNSQIAVQSSSSSLLGSGFDWPAYHVWGVEWTAGKLAYTVDGGVWGTVNSPDVPSGPMNLDIQAENVGASQTITNADFAIAWTAIYSVA